MFLKQLDEWFKKEETLPFNEAFNISSPRER
jgi:hypothetical protein